MIDLWIIACHAILMGWWQIFILKRINLCTKHMQSITFQLYPNKAVNNNNQTMIPFQAHQLDKNKYPVTVRIWEKNELPHWWWERNLVQTYSGPLQQHRVKFKMSISWAARGRLSQLSIHLMISAQVRISLWLDRAPGRALCPTR